MSVPRRSQKQAIIPDSIQHPSSSSHSLTHSRSLSSPSERTSERARSKTDRSRKRKKDNHNNAATHCSKCMDHQTRKLKKRNKHQKTNHNNSRIGFPQEFLDNHASICTNDSKSSLRFFPSSSSSSCAFCLFSSFSSRGLFVLVPVSLCFFSSLFLGGPKNRQKNDTAF